MACNHCDNPVCLKGCPTRAYTKYEEYGAVLQDPDICFGCGYCTWVCPYNAPQLDTERGHVHKCNMCVDRLEAGLKPACASACLAGALDFGVIETTPDNREQLKTQIPGFPTPDITHPNIRFQQTRTLPKEMTRTDSMDVKYRLNDDKTRYVPVVNESRARKEKKWNLKKLLSSHENAHIAFTLSTQTVIGAFMMYLVGLFFNVESLQVISSAGKWPLLLISIFLMGFGLLKLNLHLGRPHRFYRGFNNLRHSPVSREIAGVSMFFAGLTGYAFLSLFQYPILQWLSYVAASVAVLGAVVGTYYMYKLYRIPARPYWDHWQTATSFVGNTLSLGGLLMIITAILATSLVESRQLINTVSLVILAGLFIEMMGLVAHARDMKKAQHEGALSHFEQTTKYGKSYWLRNSALFIGMLLSITLYQSESTSDSQVWMMLSLLLVVSTSAIIGRALFYVLVIPTTMPGAFFWRNKGFQEHAREIGLADMPQTGVLPQGH
jgi:Fe-S-cluster-containing dehydrogenase component/DMSO reductase anchor subunit